MTGLSLDFQECRRVEIEQMGGKDMRQKMGPSVTKRVKTKKGLGKGFMVRGRTFTYLQSSGQKQVTQLRQATRSRNPGNSKIDHFSALTPGSIVLLRGLAKSLMKWNRAPSPVNPFLDRERRRNYEIRGMPLVQKDSGATRTTNAIDVFGGPLNVRDHGPRRRPFPKIMRVILEKSREPR
ncbi:hypothetical protein KIN20_035667 [Parelaphostrongylus tenuis]|uniref:Uncharacterized protein n=1 Tax=Parelaphostrongylus tenuis TaxID=148309 RepID=A0AAD5RBH5_PARTN|nr:hypothetical protein KIN20_035667 [Parelaphostrongylus tenuis]